MKIDGEKMKIDYEEVAIEFLERQGFNTEKWRLYGLPWYLKVYLYPAIWEIKVEVETAVKRLLKEPEGENDDTCCKY